MSEVFRSYWYGGKLPPYACMCINSYVTQGHTFVLYTHKGVSNAPSGCVVEPADIILSAECGAAIGMPSFNVRAFSDWFRYVLLHVYGGWWVDTDACLAPGARIPTGDYIFYKEASQSAANGIFKVPVASSLMLRLQSVFEDVRSDKDWFSNGKIKVYLEKAVTAKDRDLYDLIGNLNVGGPCWFYDAILAEGLQEYCVPYKRFGGKNLNGDQALCDSFSTIHNLYNGNFSLERDVLPRMWNIHLYGSFCTRNKFWEGKHPNSVVSALEKLYGCS